MIITMLAVLLTELLVPYSVELCDCDFVQKFHTV